MTTHQANAIYLYQVVDQTELHFALANGYVRQQRHPTEPLIILNYTEKCAYEEAWNDTTRACRGLIYHAETGRIVARGFAKFFNYGQAGAPTIDLGEYVHVTDKVDGSLGIIYPVSSGGWAVATRGSFTSDQALHATQILQTRYRDLQVNDAFTMLVEIIYPQNRIVLDYQGQDDLVYIGHVHHATGVTIWAPGQWLGPAAEKFGIMTFAEALAMPPRDNAEGIVVRSAIQNDMVKIKQANYVELHRIVTNLTARRIHDWLLTGKPVADFIAPLPDEFHAWCRDIADDITTTVDDRAAQIIRLFEHVCIKTLQDLGNPETVDLRKDRAARAAFARLAVDHEDKWALFALLDGRDIRPELLKRARPAPFLTPSGLTHTEDTA